MKGEKHLKKEDFKVFKVKFNQVGIRENIHIIKRYGNKYKLIRLNLCNMPGLTPDREIIKAKRGTANDEKLQNNLSRTKETVFQYAMCNSWTWFCTFTLSPVKYDRSDLKKFIKDLSHFIRNYRAKYKIDISYLFIPELHKDKESWHFHGLIEGIPEECLRLFNQWDRTDTGMRIPVYLWQNGYYDWPDYRKKFGWCSLSPVRSAEGVAKYITKYVSKDLGESVTELNAKSFYSSRGLKKAEEIDRGYYTEYLPDSFFDYVGDYAACKWLSPDELRIVQSSLISIK